jgi:minor histocompatibility antigen H13
MASTRGAKAKVAAVEATPRLTTHSTLIALHIMTVINALLPLVAEYPPNINVVVTASLAVLTGCVRSVKDTPPAESMTKKDAYKFPLMGSVMLFGLFLAFKFLPKDMVNMVLTLYFILLGTLGLVATVERFFVFDGSDDSPHWLKKQREIKIPGPLEPIEFSILEMLLCIPAAGFCYWYYMTKHWLANNVLGLAFSLQGVEHLSLGTVQNGVILLCGLFFYDVFWVFCTPVMVSVAKNFDAPIKLLFPKELASTEYSMLGLGDIVIPGIMVAIVLRYDVQKHMVGRKGTMLHATGSPRFFYSCFVGYVIGIASTIVVMNVFKAAQPALLYIVPSVLVCTFTHAWMVGEAKTLFHWSEAPVTEDTAAEKKKKDDGDESKSDEEEEPQQGVTTRRRRRVQRD